MSYFSRKRKDLSFVSEELAVGGHALDTDEHLSAGGVVVELNFRLALAVRSNIGLPVDGAAEVLQG